MSTESADTDISHLFATENAAPSAAEANPQPSEQPLPPDLVESYQQPSPEANTQPPQPQAPGQEQQAQQPQQQPHTVPVGELIDMRRRAQAAEESQRTQQREIDQLKQMMARLSQPQQPPQPQLDPIDDPQGFVNGITNQIEQRFLNMQLNDSERRAREKFGAADVDAAFEAAQKSGFANAFINRPDAYGEMVDWYRAQKLRETIGTDPAAYTEKLKTDLRQQILAELKQGSPPPSNLPPSLSSATKASATPEANVSDKDFFNEMMNRKRG